MYSYRDSTVKMICRIYLFVLEMNKTTFCRLLVLSSSHRLGSRLHYSHNMFPSLWDSREICEVALILTPMQLTRRQVCKVTQMHCYLQL